MSRKRKIFGILLAFMMSCLLFYAKAAMADIREHSARLDVEECCNCKVDLKAKPSRYKVGDHKANVYTAPTVTSTVIAVLEPNTAVSVKKINNGWAQVLISGGSGYMRVSDLVKT